ncbi:class I SAM-dependent DNA methyltransferase [Thiohalocapsa marina]|uniref:class I SAM-dependent DNA methyltransferase n=1 Tax=Thiohalocapsa marina TaxID=424902 RepID=UPI0036DD9623
MTPDDFIDKWLGVTQTERQSSQTHFNDLCALLEVPDPIQADPKGEWFCFERGATKAGGGDGWADVWRKGCFGWEYKRPGGDLPKALKQLQLYTPALAHPPLLIVSDVRTIQIHTAFTGLVPEVHVLSLEDLRDHNKRRLLKWAFTDPERLKPAQSTAKLTEDAAGRLATLAQSLRARGHDPEHVAHFAQQLLFCLFAEDIDLLPGNLLTEILKAAHHDPAELQSILSDLFAAMAEGGRVGVTKVPWFNGGLFQSNKTLPLEPADITLLLDLAELDWSAIDPTISGTLFERGLDPDKRAQLGAHFTDRESIMRLVDPVVLDPLRAEWTAIKPDIQRHMDKASAAKSASAKTKALAKAEALYQGFLLRLRQFRVLDPACGSGNFLLLALLGLKDLEHQVILEAEALGLPRGLPMVGPENVLGIEINPYAAELARVVVWIGEIQWMLSHGQSLSTQPILKPLDTIRCADAVLNPDGTEPEWPEADAIVGNPPFLGDKKMLGALGDEYVKLLRKLYQGRVPGGADLVTYWFEKARAQIEAGKTKFAGLVATNSIRQKRNRPVLERILTATSIFAAWSDEPWVNEGAAVRVSLVCFGSAPALDGSWLLDGQPVAAIHADLTGGETGGGLARAKPLPANAGWSYFGLCLAGPFKVPAATAQHWLTLPNPHGKPNADVLKPIFNGKDITRRWAGNWVIDFGLMDVREAELYEAPFAYVLEHVKPLRDQNTRKSRAEKWWRHGEARPGLRAKLTGLSRYLITPETAKHRFFVWMTTREAPEHSLIVIPLSDEATFGILQSHIHEAWSFAAGGRMGVGNDPRYNSTVCFSTFPFPDGLTPVDTAGTTETVDDDIILPSVAPERRPVAVEIARAAHRLNTLRERWLNPPEWVDVVPEVVPGYPDRVIPKPEHEKDLKRRTLTNLYNERPAWLDNAHKALDAAVATAYGWTDYSPDMPDDEILRRLLALNLERQTKPISTAAR